VGKRTFPDVLLLLGPAGVASRSAARTRTLRSCTTSSSLSPFFFTCVFERAKAPPDRCVIKIMTRWDGHGHITPTKGLVCAAYNNNNNRAGQREVCADQSFTTNHFWQSTIDPHLKSMAQRLKHKKVTSSRSRDVNHRSTAPINGAPHNSVTRAFSARNY
jgi:hypothetical protein